jgi:glycosyltransferase involved in cell wall biosynthesis
MNILILNWRDILHPRAGGAEVRLHEIYERLALKGHTIHLVSSLFENALVDQEYKGIFIHRLGNDFNFNWLVAFKLKKWIKKWNIDVVVEDFNKLPFWTPWLTSKPILIQMHHLWKTSIFKEASFPLASFIWIHEQFLRWTYKKSHFCVVSESTKSELISYGIKDSQIEIIYNGVDLDFYSPSQNPDENSNSLQILWLSRIQKYKGIFDALLAFQKFQKSHPDAQFLIAGSGPFKPQVEEFIAKNQLENSVKLLGFIDQEQKRTLLQQSRFLVQSSYKEGWGLTVIEANACGTPVIGNFAPGLKDSILDQKTGLLYQFADSDDLAQKMTLLWNDPQMHAEFKKNALNWAQKLTWENASTQTEKILLNLCL